MAVPAAGQPDLTRRILLDSPTAMPALGFAEIGRAFATIISQSDPRFAVGIFGGWGSGKTTLMRAIKSGLPEQGIVVVDFNAWRFEREPQLLIPLLDTIRAALVRRSQADAGARDKFRAVAGRVGRVVRALATGLSAQVGLPGAVTVSYDPAAAIAALSSPATPENAQSLYVAAFSELEDAFRELSDDEVTRMVVFVDDLDRCLPANALEVLESMKLFFDLPGFVFVVGLDEDVVERAIRAKFGTDQDEAASADAPAGTAVPAHLGREYVKKIFQVPYSIPAMLPHQLDVLLNSMYAEAGLAPAQLADLSMRVRPFLGYVAVGRRVNPREVKRFINAYTLQTMVRPELDPDTVLALQTLAFRPDWTRLYDAILADSALFADALRRYRLDQQGQQFPFEDLAPELGTLPASLAGYLRSDRAEALTRHDSLDNYLTSLQSYRTTGSWELEAFRRIGALRREIRLALDQAQVSDSILAGIMATAADTTVNVMSLLGATPTGQSAGLMRAVDEVKNIAAGLAGIGIKGPDEAEAETRARLIQLRDATDRAREELQLLRDSSILQP